MDHPFKDLIEQQIEKFRAQGGLDGLEGAGKPLPDRSSEAHLDAATAAAGRMMAQAGAVPEELTLKTQLDEARKAFAALPQTPSEAPPEARKAALARIADLELRYNLARDARRKFMK